MARTKAVRTIQTLLFMHSRVLSKPPQDDPPRDLAPGKNPSLNVSRALFIREAEKKWNVSSLLVEDLLILEDAAVRGGSLRLQSEVCASFVSCTGDPPLIALFKVWGSRLRA